MIDMPTEGETFTTEYYQCCREQIKQIKEHTDERKYLHTTCR